MIKRFLMDKRALIIVSAVLILLIPGAIIAFSFKRRASVISPLVAPVKESGSAVKLTTWEDPAGFKFSYPQDLAINPHEEDTENYAHLELTSPAYEGKIIIWVKDTNHISIEDWVEEVGERGQILDTELGGEPAKKIVYSNPQKMVTAAIDVDALVLLEMTPDELGYWQQVYGQILSSFTFIPLEGEAPAVGAMEGHGEAVPGSGGGAGTIIEEPEEVIE